MKNPKERRNPSLLLSAVLHAYSRIGVSSSLLALFGNGRQRPCSSRPGRGFGVVSESVELIADDLGQDVEHLVDERIDGGIRNTTPAALT